MSRGPSADRDVPFVFRPLQLTSGRRGPRQSDPSSSPDLRLFVRNSSPSRQKDVILRPWSVRHPVRPLHRPTHTCTTGHPWTQTHDPSVRITDAPDHFRLRSDVRTKDTKDPLFSQCRKTELSPLSEDKMTNSHLPLPTLPILLHHLCMLFVFRFICGRVHHRP